MDQKPDPHDNIVKVSRFTTKEKTQFNGDGSPGNFEPEEDETQRNGPGERARPHRVKENQLDEENRLKGEYESY